MNTQTVSAAGLWTVGEVARYLQKSSSWVYKQVNEGRLPVRRIGGNLRFRQSDIDDYVVGAWQPLKFSR